MIDTNYYVMLSYNQGYLPAKGVSKMKILFAVSDRDFLSSFAKLFEISGYETDTTFDGAQTLRKISETAFDLVILERTIPRVKCGEIIQILQEKDIPVIVISEKSISSSMLLGNNIANAYISLPFLPQELLELASEVINRRKSSNVFSRGDIVVSEGSFMLCGKQRITCREMDVLSALSQDKEIDAKRMGAYINSLNIKIEGINKKPRIKYINGEGYRLVNNNE